MGSTCVANMSVSVCRVLWLVIIVLADRIQGYVETEEFISDLDKPSKFYYDIFFDKIFYLFQCILFK